jgi:hypothetical protein
VVKYHGLARRYLIPPRFLMRPLLNGGTLGGQSRTGRVPRIPDKLQRSIVFIYPNAATAAAGTGAGGTGFLLLVPGVKRPEPFVYLVTNIHVAQSSAKSVRLSVGPDRFEIVNIAPEDWVNHPDGDDVAVVEINQS